MNVLSRVTIIKIAEKRSPPAERTSRVFEKDHALTSFSLLFRKILEKRYTKAFHSVNRQTLEDFFLVKMKCQIHLYLTYVQG